MKQRTKAIKGIILSVIFVLCLFVGCKDNDEDVPEYDMSGYAAYHVSHINKPMKKSFLYAEENRICAAYPSENYDPNDSYNENFMDFDLRGLPESRIILVTDQAQMEEAFEEVPMIDLEMKMVMIIIFSSFRKGETLQNVKIEDGILEAIISYKAAPNYPQPILGYFAWQLDKFEITDTKVSYVKIK